VSRIVVRKVIRSKATEFRYEREAQLLPKVGPWQDKLVIEQRAMFPMIDRTGRAAAF
jgi:hypothetical protein